MLDALTAAGIEFASAEITMMPKNTVQLEENDAPKIIRIIDALEDNDDVQEVYANFDISDEVLEALAGLIGAGRRERPTVRQRQGG